MHKLDCAVQKYDWGRRGHESSVALFKSTQNKSFQIVTEDAYAELWMGTHSNGPSTLVSATQHESNMLLSEYLKEKGDAAIGPRISAHFNAEQEKPGDLPFLFKVLSIGKALSIQAHPGKQLAAQLHQRDPKHYPDSNHKPEMLIAISEHFEAMCGFRPAEEIANHFHKYAELVELCGVDNCDSFMKEAHDQPNSGQLEQLLATCFKGLMSKEAAVVSQQFVALKERLSARDDLECSDLERLFLRLAVEYPHDVGCFVVFFLNCFKLKRGEAIYLAANVPHAYLYGDGVECMACSDNVVRAGLTPKFKDVDTLCSMLDYSMRSADENKLSSTRTAFSQDKSYLVEFRPTVDEFSIQQIRIEASHLNGSATSTFLLPKCESGSILIVIDSLSANNGFKVNDLQLPAEVGSVYFIDANVDVRFTVEASQEAVSQSQNVLLAYRAYCDIKA